MASLNQASYNSLSSIFNIFFSFCTFFTKLLHILKFSETQMETPAENIDEIQNFKFFYFFV